MHVRRRTRKFNFRFPTKATRQLVEARRGVRCHQVLRRWVLAVDCSGLRIGDTFSNQPIGLGLVIANQLQKIMS